MKFSEAMRLLEEGKKVKCVYWREGTYIQLKGDVIYDDEGETYEIPGLIIEEDWEEYIEPETNNIEPLEPLYEDVFFGPIGDECYGFIGTEPALVIIKDKINEIIERMNGLCGEK